MTLFTAHGRVEAVAGETVGDAEAGHGLDRSRTPGNTAILGWPSNTVANRASRSAANDVGEDAVGLGPLHHLVAADHAEVPEIDGLGGIRRDHGEDFSDRHVLEGSLGFQHRQGTVQALGVQDFAHAPLSPWFRQSGS